MNRGWTRSLSRSSRHSFIEIKPTRHQCRAKLALVAKRSLGRIPITPEQAREELERNRCDVLSEGPGGLILGQRGGLLTI